MDDLRLNATLNKSGFSQGLQAIRQESKQAASEMSKEFSSSWGGIGKGMLGGFAAAVSFEGVKSFMESIFSRGKEIRETADAFDVSTDSIQQWEKALGKAGLSTNVFYRALEQLRTKRQEAREDSSKMGGFNAVGLGKEAIGSMSDLDLMKKILDSGASRPDIAALLGKKAPQLQAAMGKLSGEAPMFSKDDIEAMHQAEQSAKSLTNSIKKLGLEAMMGSGAFGKIFSALVSPFNVLIPGAKPKSKRQEEIDETNRKDEEAMTFMEGKKQIELRDRRDQKNQFDKVTEANDRIEQIKRSGMASGQRRESLQKELAGVRSRTQYARVETNLDPTVSSEDFERKRQLKILELQAKEAQLTNDLKEKPLSVLTGGKAKAGLFSAGEIAGAGIGSVSATLIAQLSVQREMNSHLRQIAGTDAHRP